jgi:putative transposase
MTTSDDTHDQPAELPGGSTATSRFLSDAQWAALERVLPPPDDNNFGQAEADRREFVEALFWMAFHGCGWAGLPEARWNAESLRRKRQRWRDRGWLALLQSAASNVGLPDWLRAVAVVAFDPAHHVPRATSRGTWMRGPRSGDAPGDAAPDGTGVLVPDASFHVPADVPAVPQPTSRDGEPGREAGRDAGQGAGREAGRGARAQGVSVTALDQASMEELARLISSAMGSGGGGGGGRGGRGRGGRSELATVWGDVPVAAKAGLAVAIALLTASTMTPIYLRGMSPFAGDLRDSFDLPMWAASLVVVFGPPIYVLLVMGIVYALVRRGQRMRERRG